MFSYMKQGSAFYKSVVSLAIPMVLQNMVTASLGLLDTFMVGLLGEAPMAAVTMANTPVMIVMLMTFGLQSGGSVLMSQFYGKEDYDSINRVLGIGFYAASFVTLLFGSILFFFPNQFMGLFGNDPTVVALSAKYARIVAFSFFFDCITSVYVAAHRSMANPKPGLYIFVSSMVINTFLNWVFIFGKLGAPALGVEGAALATLIARAMEVAIVVAHMVWNRFFRVHLHLLLRPGLDMARRFLRYGGLVVFNETTWGLGSSIFPTIMGHMEGSTEILAAYTVAGNVDKICMVVSFGLAATASIIIGREVGAGRLQKVRSSGAALCAVSLLCGTAIGLSLFLFARFLAPAWVFPLFKMSARSASIAVMMMTVQAAVRPLRDFNSVAIVGVLRGGGDVRMATIIDTAPQWLIAIPAAVLLGSVLKLDILWVYLAMTLENIVKFIFGLQRIRSDSWIRDLTRT